MFFFFSAVRPSVSEHSATGTVFTIKAVCFRVVIKNKKTKLISVSALALTSGSVDIWMIYKKLLVYTHKK